MGLKTEFPHLNLFASFSLKALDYKEMKIRKILETFKSIVKFSA